MDAKGAGVRASNRFMPAEMISDINVTPFVDVMLVLLIIFMVAAPMMTVSVPLQLPRSAATEAPVDPITISFSKGGEVYLMNKKIKIESLVAKIKAMSNKDAQDQRILIRGDVTAEYGKFVAVMSALSLAGYTRLGIVTEGER